MKLTCWNVNGLRAVLQKGFVDYVKETDPDVICLNEIKLSDCNHNIEELSNYNQHYYCANKKGYSGTAILTKLAPISVHYGINQEEHDQEGRVLTAEYENFYLVCVYVPNSQRGLTRLEYRQEWNIAFENYIADLDKIKPVIVCGDMNVAHKEIDIKNAKSNERNAGFTIEERNDFSRMLERGFTDSFRYIHPDEIKYSWWSYMFNARANNVGWRIDYFLVSNKIKESIEDADISTEILGSDHCPITLNLSN